MISNSSWGLITQKYLSFLHTYNYSPTLNRISQGKKKEIRVFKLPLRQNKTKQKPTLLCNLTHHTEAILAMPLFLQQAKLIHHLVPQTLTLIPNQGLFTVPSTKILFTLVISWISSCHLGLSLSTLIPEGHSLTTQI